MMAMTTAPDRTIIMGNVAICAARFLISREKISPLKE